MKLHGGWREEVASIQNVYQVKEDARGGGGGARTNKRWWINSWVEVVLQNQAPRMWRYSIMARGVYFSGCSKCGTTITRQ